MAYYFLFISVLVWSGSFMLDYPRRGFSKEVILDSSVLVLVRCVHFFFYFSRCV